MLLQGKAMAVLGSNGFWDIGEGCKGTVGRILHTTSLTAFNTTFLELSKIGNLMQAKVMAVLSSKGFVDSSQGCEGTVGLVLDTTNFYAEQGGQVSDVGSLTSSSGRTFDVQDAQVIALTD